MMQKSLALCFCLLATVTMQAKSKVNDPGILSVSQSNKDLSLPVFTDKQNAVITGEIVKYRPSTPFRVGVEYADFITFEKEMCVAEVDAKGRFRVEIPLYAPAKVFLSIDSVCHFGMYVAPGEVSEVVIRPKGISGNATSASAGLQAGKNEIRFKGACALLNRQSNAVPLQMEIVPEAVDIMPAVAGLSPEEYVAYWMKKLDEVQEVNNNTAGAGDTYKKIANLSCAVSVVNILRYPPKDRKKITLSYYDFIKKMGFDDPLCFYADGFFPMIVSLNNGPLAGFMNNLVEDALGQGDFTAEEKDKIQIAFQKNIKPDVEEKRLNAFVSLLNASSRQKRNYTLENARKLMGTDKGLFMEMMAFCDMLVQVRMNKKPLDPTQFARLNTFAYPGYASAATFYNEALLARIEANRSKTGYVKREVPEHAGNSLFSTIMNQYKGKTVLVDCWGTTCAPCLKIIRELRPVKDSLAGNGIVYVYLTSEKLSPRDAWENAIPDISGEHYRLSQAQWKLLFEDSEIKTYPTYLLVDKTGNVTLMEDHSPHAIRESLLKSVE